MKLIFLRGHVPQDRDPHEIMFDSLPADTDMWMHLASALGDELCDVVYWGGKRVQYYSEKDTVLWVPKIKNYKPSFRPDAIFERGGFDEGRYFSQIYRSTYRIYYGSGARYMPKDRRVRYNLVLVDSERQLHKARKHGWNAHLWRKPAAPQFRPMPEVAKEYDVCYVADGRFPFRAKIKNVDWVYKRAPKDLKILHLGWSGDRKVPKNITVKRIQRGDMPFWYNKCRIGIVPYTDYDSAPRVISEMLACNLWVIASNEVNQCYHIPTAPLDKLWDEIKTRAKSTEPMIITDDEFCMPTIPTAADHIKEIINEGIQQQTNS